MEFYRRHFEEVQQRLHQLSPLEADSFEGATDQEITELEAYAGGKFPLVYRMFLQMMGRNAGQLFQGSDALISQRWSIRFRAFAQKIISEQGGSDSLPESAFVFLMHQGYVFLFFRLDEGENPPVYVVTDSEPEPKLLSENFTNFVERYVADLEELAATKPMR